ncbi:cellulose binding domain-containing protein [Actinospica robiniae]|uniref:cellulose binding domain-containing protein n=1 Tax=Actinospica robiniae TaxID=304901 RepID=UPI0004171701|nr:cellulose binding domain-containing protein [Actinospica robiniae]
MRLLRHRSWQAGGSAAVPAAAGCQLSYTVTSQWQGGFGANATVTNASCDGGGESIRTHNQTPTIDPCDIEHLYQSPAPGSNQSYHLLPWRIGPATVTDPAC